MGRVELKGTRERIACSDLEASIELRAQESSVEVPCDRQRLIRPDINWGKRPRLAPASLLLQIVGCTKGEN